MSIDLLYLVRVLLSVNLQIVGTRSRNPSDEVNNRIKELFDGKNYVLLSIQFE